MANHPTTSSQPTTSQNNGHVYYMTYSDDDSIFNDDEDEQSGNTRPWQAVVKKRKRNPRSKPTEHLEPTKYKIDMSYSKKVPPTKAQPTVTLATQTQALLPL
jgi:hypothetical protein